MSEKLANEAVVDRAIASIGGLRVDAGEVYLRDGQSTSVEVRDGAIENAITRGERGIGVRVLRGGHVGFAYSSDLSPDGIEDCVGAARDIAARLAVQNVAADPAPAGTYTVVLSSEAGGTLIHE